MRSIEWWLKRSIAEHNVQNIKRAETNPLEPGVVKAVFYRASIMTITIQEVKLTSQSELEAKPSFFLLLIASESSARLFSLSQNVAMQNQRNREIT